MSERTQNLYFYKIAQKNHELFKINVAVHHKIKPFILFAHAFTGCDSTSAIFSKGKKSFISLLEKNENLQDAISIFHLPNKTVDELYNVSETVIKQMYGEEKVTKSLANLRFEIFQQKTFMKQKAVSLENLPPTIESLTEHIKRVYYQIQLWQGNPLDPENWGWTRNKFMLIPIMTSKDVAPKELLEKVCS